MSDCPEVQDPERLRGVRNYAILLWVKNQQFNLTRHTSWDQFVTRDLWDTIQLSRLIEESEEVLDIGSGGGVPGLLLAILRPDLTVTLTESVGKKAAALNEFAQALELNVTIFGDRAESILEDFRFHTATARAVGPLVKLLRWLDGHWVNVDRLLAVKGPRWMEERGEAESAGLLQNVQLHPTVEYPTPGTEWNSVILEIESIR